MNKQFILSGMILFTLLCITPGFLSGQTRASLDPVFQNHMVLQQQVPVNIFGLGNANEWIDVTFGGDRKRVQVSANEKWRVSFDPQKASFTPHSILINGDTMVTNVLVGDVWLFAGQSNMGISMKGCGLDNQQFSAEYENIRINKYEAPRMNFTEGLSVESLKRLNTDDFFQHKWMINSATTKASTSAVAYITAAYLGSSLSIPIGLVQVGIGGSSINNWVSPETLKQLPEGKKLFEGNWLDNPLVNSHHIRQAKGGLPSFIDSATVWKVGEMPYRWYREPGFLYEASIGTLSALPIKGMVWYQGESDCTSPEIIEDYIPLFEGFVADYRKAYKSEFPVYIVGLPGLDRRNWDAFRIMQNKLVEKVANTFLIVTFDTGGATNLHPKDKEPVARRAAHLITKQSYNHGKLISFPEVVSIKVKGNRRILLHLNNSGKGLQTNTKTFPGFQWRSPDGSVFDLGAKIKGKSKILLEFPKELLGSGKLVYGYYGWPDRNSFIYNSDGLPLAPFVQTVNF